MCNAELERLKNRVKYSSRDSEEYTVSTSIVTKRKYLGSIKGYPRPNLPPWPSPKLTWCPKANMYYAFNEDTNPFTRVSEFAETVCNCSQNEHAGKLHFPPKLDPFIDRDPYSEDEARNKQLATDPACFAIFGKPDLNGTRLAKLIAEYWNCVFISPQVLIEEEIEAKTDKGRWMKEVLRSGRSIGPEIVMNLIESRINAKDTMHRGYVVEGLPLIPNDLDLDYGSYPNVSSVKIPSTPTKVVTFNVDKNDYKYEENEENLIEKYEDEISDVVVDEELLESEKSFDDSDSSKSYDLARNPFATESLRMILRDDYQWDIGNQIQEMFNSWTLKPTVIVYIICPDPEVINRRCQFKFSPYSGETIDAGLWKMNEKCELPLSGSETEEYEAAELMELKQEIIDEETLIENDLKKHLLTRVSNMRSNVEVQCKIFKQYALPWIEKQVLAHNPQNVIRVDGRTSVMRMFQLVRVRLRTLPLPRVILPRKIFDEDKEFVDDEGFSVYEDFDGKTNEEALQELIIRDAISPRFLWRLSRWKFLCPVALAQGQKIEGSIKNAVRFMNKLYFLSSLAAVKTFVDNPRPFLLPPNPKPICKILIYGPKYSGKTNLAEFLAHIYGGRLLDLKAIENREINHRRNLMIRDAIDEILDDVIDELTEVLENQREEREVERIAALKVWHNEAQLVAENMLRILGSRSIKKEGDVVHKNPDKVDEELEELREEIEKYNLTSLYTDSELCERILRDKNYLLDLAPTELITTEAPVYELNEQDPEVAKILMERTRDVRKIPIELSIEDVSKLLVANINAAQTSPNSFGLKETGWIIDGMYADVALLENVLEKGIEIEEVIVIHELEPYDNLIENLRKNKVADENKEEGENEEEEEEEETFDSDAEKLQDPASDIETLDSQHSTVAILKTVDLNEYINELKQFEANWENIIKKIQETDAEIIDVLLPVKDGIENYVKQQIDYRYKPIATIMTDEEKEREAEDANETEIMSSDEEFVEEEEEISKEFLPKKDERRLGDTGIFCPVALHRYKVLWKGKEEFSALFMDKIYLLSSQVALDEFLLKPQDFVPHKKPIESIPLLKVSIVGPIGSGKSTLAKAISSEYGLAHINFPERLNQYLKDRCIPLVGRKREDIYKDSQQETEPEETVELPEDLEDQRYNYDRATIQAFVRKYLEEGAVLPKRMLKECLTDLWEPPYQSVGLVFDNFPSNSYDAVAACDNFAVPEIVLELICSIEETQARMIPKLYEEWKTKQDEKKTEEDLRFKTEMEKVFRKRKRWISKKIKERRRLRRAQLLATSDDNVNDQEEKYDLTSLSSETKTDSFLKTTPPAQSSSPKLKKSESESDSSDSNIEESDENQTEIDLADLQEESLIVYEDPIKFEDWEDPEAARERITQEVDQDYTFSSENLASARTVFEQNSVPWIEIDAEQNETSVLISVLKILDPHVFRNGSVLERIYQVDTEIAEQLLDCGYYFLSSFGRCCPVQIYENKIPFQMFLPGEKLQNIYTVLHRDYVYFLFGEQRLASFLENPLKYLDQDSCMPLIPARIAIIGPPKCGKTTIANRFARTYGMKAITRGQALRKMLKDFSWTELANLTNAHLQDGHTALNESIARAVELHSMDSRSVSQGYVLDGFPENQSEAEELAFLGICPMIFIDLRADLNFCLTCLATDSKIISKPSVHSPCYLSHRYEEWQLRAEEFRNWLKNYAQNLIAIDATSRKLAVWTNANDETCLRLNRIKKYFRESDYDKAQSLTYMCISPYEFRARQSKYENYCPVCLSSQNVLTLSETPPSHDGMVQFRYHYYWVCKKHLKNFLADPLTILSSMNDIALPKFRPEIIDEEVNVNHACWAKRLKVGGSCPVTYLDNLPQRQVVPGLNTLGVMFKEKLYLFCSTECRDKFMSQPSKYADVTINFRHSLPPVKINNLPNLGFLEQTVAGLIVRAVNKVSVLRAKLPGMTPEVTAAVYIGVYLKIHNTESDLNEVDIYEEVMRRMNARRHLLQIALRNAKKKINPYVSFPPEDRIVREKIRSSVQLRNVTSAQYFNIEEYKRSSSNSQSSI